MGEASGPGGRLAGVLLPTPAPEVLETVLRQRYGPLPRAAAIARLRRQRDGGYQPAGDLAGVLERRQAANAKERERVRGPPKAPLQPPPNLPSLRVLLSHRGGSQGCCPHCPQVAGQQVMGWGRGGCLDLGDQV